MHTHIIPTLGLQHVFMYVCIHACIYIYRDEYRDIHDLEHQGQSARTHERGRCDFPNVVYDCKPSTVCTYMGGIHIHVHTHVPKHLHVRIHIHIHIYVGIYVYVYTYGETCNTAYPRRKVLIPAHSTEA